MDGQLLACDPILIPKVSEKLAVHQPYRPSRGRLPLVPVPGCQALRESSDLSEVCVDQLRIQPDVVRRADDVLRAFAAPVVRIYVAPQLEYGLIEAVDSKVWIRLRPEDVEGDLAVERGPNVTG